MAQLVTRTVEVTMLVDVTTDDDAFTPEFMEEFRGSFFQFFDMKDHAEHIAQLAAREVAEFGSDRSEFVEGYGPIGDMGIKAHVADTYMTLIGTSEAPNA